MNVNEAMGEYISWQKLFQIAQYNDQERFEYLESIKDFRDFYATLKTAKGEGIEIGHEKGLKEGIEIGKKEGIEIGHNQGKKEGIAESVKTIMEKLSMDFESAAAFLNIPQEQIEEMRKMSL